MTMHYAGRHVAPGSNLPDYPRDGRGPHYERELERFGEECVSAVETLDRVLNEVAEVFVEAFDAEDKRAAAMTRINGRTNHTVEREDAKRKRRIG